MSKRTAELRKLGILDTPEEEVFNEIVKTASLICHAPISLITLLDEERQWFKAKIGTEIPETPITISICNHVVNEKEDYLYVNDLTKDSRFVNNPFVTNEPNLRSYYGVALVTENNVRIGTVCVFDDKVRDFDQTQITCLNTLAKCTMHIINEKLSKRNTEKKNDTLLKLHKNLEAFSHIVAHDIKAPVRAINGFTQLVLRDTQNTYSEKSKEYLEFITNSAHQINDMVNTLLDYSKKINIDIDDITEVDLVNEIEEVIKILDPKKESLQYNIDTQLPKIYSYKLAIHHTILNILSNAIKYRDSNKSSQYINIDYGGNEKYTELTFTDNGIGMSEDRLSQVFQLFSNDNRTQNSSGIGLSITKDILSKIESHISLDSELNNGTTVTLKLKKF